MEYNIDDLLEEAKNEIKNLLTEEIFLVKDLFKGYRWKRIPVNKRMKLGTFFLEYAQKNELLDILEKTSSNQQKYKKV